MPPIEQGRVFPTVAANWEKVNRLKSFAFLLPQSWKEDALLRIVKDYDEATFAHMKGVHYWTCCIENILGIHAPNLETAALLHDVGKIGVPIPLLHPADSTKITESEQRLRNQHIQSSAFILRELHFPSQVVLLAQYHETPFSELKKMDELFSGDYCLSSIIRVADVMVAALENPLKYRNPTFIHVVGEIAKQVEMGMIQREVAYPGSDSFFLLGDLFNEHSSHLPRPISTTA